MAAICPAPYSVESLRRTVQSLTVELLAVYEELALLYSLSGQMGRAADEAQIAAIALKEALEIASADCGWVAIWERDKLRVHENCIAGVHRGIVEEVHRAALEPAFLTGKREFVSNRLAQEHGIAGMEAPARFLASALEAEGRPRGYLCVGRRASRAAFLSPDQKLIGAVALLLAVELENLRLQRSEIDRQRLANEMKLARAIQQSLLPRDFSRIAFLEAAGASEPCGEIGGDFFDLVSIDAGRCALVIADVSGKGPPAALQAAMVQGVVSAVSRTCPEPAFLTSMMNTCLLNHPAADRFVTAFAAALDCTGRLQYANAGHPAPLWIRNNGDILELGHTGPLLGVFQQAEYSQRAVTLMPGDLLVMYTDGLTEARDRAGRVFGIDRLLEWAGRQNGLPPDSVKRDLALRVGEFCGGYRQEDDRSVLVVQYSGGEARITERSLTVGAAQSQLAGCCSPESSV